MTERGVFQALRSWLVRQGYTLRKIFWITGIISFFLSPIADNLTTALVMCAVVMAVGQNNVICQINENKCLIILFIYTCILYTHTFPATLL